MNIVYEKCVKKNKIKSIKQKYTQQQENYSKPKNENFKNDLINQIHRKKICNNFENIFQKQAFSQKNAENNKKIINNINK